MVSALGLIRVVSNSELVAQEQASARQEAYERNLRPELQGLAKHVMECWEMARDAKNAVLPRLQRAQRARFGEYDPKKLEAIRQFGGSEEYARVTANKCRIVESWLRDVFLGQSERPWTLNPTPKPDFPPEIEQQVKNQLAMEVAAVYAQTGQFPDPTQVRSVLAAQLEAVEERLRDEARKSTKRMERKMADQLAQGGFNEALGEFIADLTTYPSAIIKGPVLRRKQQLTWKNTNGAVSPAVEESVQPEFERVDPFRAYPAPGACTPQDGFFIEHVTYTEADLYDLIGAPGFDEQAIRAVLNEADGGGLYDWLGFLTDAADKDKDGVPRSLRRKVFNIDCLAFHGPVKGKDLLEWGVDQADIDDPDASYESCVWLIGNWVIKAQLNYDPLGQRGYFKASYESLPGEFWGASIPDVLDDVQGVVNAAVRGLVNNMGMASGPQVEVNVDRLDPSENPDEMYPWKRWKTVDSQYGGNNGPALNFFQPNSNVQELLAVIDKFYQLADDFSLVPRYMAGSDRVAGAGRTASGLSMLMDAANKGLKGVVSNIDEALSGLLSKLYAHNMQYDEDQTIKGDAQVVARGAVSLMQLETLQLRRNEFLQATANPVDMQIVGLEGRAEILRETVKGLEMDTSRIVPPREVLAQQMQPQMPAGPQQAQVGSGEQLQNGAATTDNFSKNAMTP